MGRNRMFDDEEPEVDETAEPRTTIVGGRPPAGGGDAVPVPTGIQRLLRLAAVDADLGRTLVERRAEVAEACGVVLTPSERAILAAIDAEQLAGMIAHLPPPEVARRSFLLKTAAAALVVLGGAGLSGCKTEGQSGAGEDSPARPDRREFELEGGASPHEPKPNRVESREVMTAGGAAPDEPPLRPDRVPSPPGGARPDEPPPKPKPKPDGGVDGGDADAPFAPPPPGWDGGQADEPQIERPHETRPTRGIRFDIPRDVPPKPKK